MVLLSDGKTRVVLPYKVLGESIVEQSPLDKGPKGHEVPPAKGKLGGTIPGKNQGDSPTPDQSTPPKAKGASKPSSAPAQPQGKGLPSSPVQVPGSPMPATISGKAVEDIRDEVLAALSQLSETTEAKELVQLLINEDDPVIYAIMHHAIFGEGDYTVATLREVADMMKDKKKKSDDDDDDEDDEDDDDDTEESYTEADIAEVFQALENMRR
jgi:hypothetical protein